jgi:nucleotide-binding universal stress UspA family protein
MKILVPVDGSPYTKRMLGYLAAHDEWLGSEHRLTVVHSVPAIPARVTSVIDRDTIKAYYEEAAEKVFKPIRSFFAKKPGMKVDYLTRSGPAGENIAALAQKGDYDLIMMGSHGHGTLKNLVMGSVATSVLASCKTPVLLVR